MTKAGRQLELFSASEPAKPLEFSVERELAARLPEHLRLGTSSWTFPGWAGIVYPSGTSERDLLDHGLELYAKNPLFSTVGIDRSYYAPLEPDTLRRYASELQPGFRAVMKVFNELTSAVHPKTRDPNPRFLDARAFEQEVLSPVAAHFGEHAGPFVFEIMPLARRELQALGDFSEWLDRFLSLLSREFSYAVELRNPELLTPRHLEVLSRHGVAHVFNFWERMPEIGAQLALPGALTAPFAVARLMLPPGRRYDARKRELAPFDRIVDPQPAMRDDVARLSEACELLGKVLFVIANNKAEGSSPLTIRAIAERIVSGRGKQEGAKGAKEAGEG